MLFFLNDVKHFPYHKVYFYLDLKKKNYMVCCYMDNYNLFNQDLIEFRLLLIFFSATMKYNEIFSCICFHMWVILTHWWIPRYGIAVLKSMCIFNFDRRCKSTFKVVGPISKPTNSVWKCLFSHMMAKLFSPFGTMEGLEVMLQIFLVTR